MTHIRHIAFAALVAAFLLVTAGCGVSDDSSGTSSPAAEVAIRQFRFDLETIEVEAGTTVSWTNRDRILHTVTAGTPDTPLPAGFDGSLEGSGAMFSVKFTDPGTYTYFCAVHPHMRGQITVTG